METIIHNYFFPLIKQLYQIKAFFRFQFESWLRKLAKKFLLFKIYLNVKENIIHLQFEVQGTNLCGIGVLNTDWKNVDIKHRIRC